MSDRAVYFVIYQITNMINLKTYIGKHKTTNLHDNYMGSRKLLKRAIQKYGVENFSKEILHVFDNEVDMNAKEAELVTEEFVLQETNYNLCVGGHGGWSYVNKSIWTEEKRLTHNKSISPFGTQLQQSLLNANPVKYSQDRSRAAKKLQALRKEGIQPQPFAGKTHTPETKAKMSANSKGKTSGSKNSQFGSKWITNGTQNKKIKINDIIPDGWYYGRTVK